MSAFSRLLILTVFLLAGQIGSAVENWSTVHWDGAQARLSDKDYPWLQQVGVTELNLNTEPEWPLVLAALQRQDPSKALFPLTKIGRTGRLQTDRIIARALLVEIFYSGHLWQDCLSQIEAVFPMRPLSWLALRSAEIKTYYLNQFDSAKVDFRKVQVGELLDVRDRSIYGLLKNQLQFQRYELRALGLSDNNVSALQIDADDLWIGTWNGGLARLSLASGSVQVFRQGQYTSLPTSLRAIGVSEHFVFAASIGGISRYSKVTGSTYELPLPEGLNLERIQTILPLDDSTFWVTTLGQGLWQYRHQVGWSHQNNNRPELSFSTWLSRDFSRQGNRFFVGTMDRGAFWGPEDDLQPLSAAASLPTNITFIHPFNNYLIIGTYGEGLFFFDLARQEHFKLQKAAGEIPDNWVLCCADTDHYLYFGTLGGGVFRLSKSNLHSVETVEGAPKDVTALVSVSNRLIAGTLGDGLISWED